MSRRNLRNEKSKSKKVRRKISTQEAVRNPSLIIGPSGVFAWTCTKEDGPLLPGNYLFLSEEITPQVQPNDLTDFVFPVLMGIPDNTPLEQSWINRLRNMFRPGCYLICSQRDLPAQSLTVVVYGVNVAKKLNRLKANLYFLMFSANPVNNFYTTQLVDQIDDLDKVKGYYYPHHIELTKTETVIHLSKSADLLLLEEVSGTGIPYEQQLKRQHGAKRVMKRVEDLIDVHSRFLPNLEHLHESFVAEKSLRSVASQRFTFFLSQDSYAVIADQNSHMTPNTRKAFLRLIRAGAYITIEGTSRYTNLLNEKGNFLNRFIFLCRLTTFPMIVVQEGIKAFDVYYTKDGLDFTYIDVHDPTKLIIVDWYQIQIDFKLDKQRRQFKGHIMRFEEIHDILNLFKYSELKYDMDLAKQMNVSELPKPLHMEKELKMGSADKAFAFSIQQVFYTYIDSLNGVLEVIVNMYYRIEPEHLRVYEQIVSGSTPNPLYLYVKSFSCIYKWKQNEHREPIQEETLCKVTLPEVDISSLDLARVGWSRQDFDQILQEYVAKLYPYQNSIKRFLLNECRKVSSLAQNRIVRPTTLTDKLIFRNNSFNEKEKSVRKRK